ncbi:MAG: ATP-binding protein [Bacteroidales bacterium]|nr:ATP-binding protein [Bacteroidales bacterium]
MVIERAQYVDKLLEKSWNGKVKIVTGIRRCGKSYLLRTLFKNALLAKGVKTNQFIEIDLEQDSQARYRNPIVLGDYVRQLTTDTHEQYYLFIDEIQRSYRIKNEGVDELLVPEEDRELLYTTFYDVLSGLMQLPNVDVYVTGSNSRMLSTDIVTNFRDRGTEIKVYPLSFAEYYAFAGLERAEALEEYLTYGGLPLAVLEQHDSEKQAYLQNLHKNVYLKDIVERQKLRDDNIIDALTDAIYSAVGSLSNPHKLAQTTGSMLGRSVADSTIKSYLDFLMDAYLVSEANRWDVKGKRYFSTIKKYYVVDLGLRNARLNWRQQERSHLMENLLYNELIHRGYSVDVGVVEKEVILEGKKQHRQYEIDFVVNTGNSKVYIQSALNVDTPEKKAQETYSLRNTNDFCRKIVVVDGSRKLWTDEDGVVYVGIIPLLLDGLLTNLVS